MTATPSHPQVDPDRTEPLNAFDTPIAYSGQEYDEKRQARQRASEADPVSVAAPADDRELPPESGRRASISPNGEVHGSGAGAGGGAPGEDFDSRAGGAPETPQAGAAPDRG